MRFVCSSPTLKCKQLFFILFSFGFLKKAFRLFSSMSIVYFVFLSFLRTLAPHAFEMLLLFFFSISYSIIIFVFILFLHLSLAAEMMILLLLFVFVVVVTDADVDAIAYLIMLLCVYVMRCGFEFLLIVFQNIAQVDKMKMKTVFSICRKVSNRTLFAFFVNAI